MVTARQIPLVLRAARTYRQRGWAPIPVPGDEKEPVIYEWQKLRLAESELSQHFGANDNVGLLLGEPSGGLCDADLDTPEAVAAAPYFMPETGRVHGRPGNPNSHLWYTLRGELKTKKFWYIAPDKEKTKKETMFVEVRWTGCQTLVPPSRHPSGEQYIWHKRDDPTVVDAPVLLRAAAKTAACALLARMWPGEGSRDNAALALTGLLLRAGWGEAETDHFVTTVATIAGDEEAEKRAKAAGTARKLAAGEEVTGGPRLAELLIEGQNVVNYICRWLGVGKARTSTYSDDAWEEPIVLSSEMPPVAALDMAMLPAAFRGYIWDIAERQQVPVDYPAVALNVGAGAVIGRRIGIRPKKHDDWTVTPTPWGALIGPSGWLKTPSMNAAMKPIERLIEEARADHDLARQTYEAEKLTAEIQKAALIDEIKKAAKEKKSTEDVAQLKGQLAALQPPQEPKARRYRTNDPTVEKLAELLIANPAGLLIFRDELMGWLRTMDKQGHESDRAFYNECWGGTRTNYEVDRIGRGSIIVPALCVSVLGGIQPGPLRGYVYAASDNGKEDADGFIQRFQLLVWPDAQKQFRIVDRWPNREAKQAVRDVFTRLANLNPADYGAVTDDDADPYAIPTLRFSDDAQAVFYEWWEGLEQRIRSGDLPDAFASHLAKYRSLMPALALLFHLIDADTTEAGSVGFVGVSPTLQAIAWCEYLETHARRVYASAVSPSMERASALLKRIKRGDVSDGCSVRDIYGHGWERLQTIEATEDALQTLEAYGWVRVETPPSGPKGGRPSKIVHIHPSLRSAKGKGGIDDGDD